MKNHSRDSKSILLRVLLYLFVILVVLVTLYPYFVMFTTAAKSRAEIYSPEGTLLPIQWLWQNFKDIWTLAPLSRYFLNSLIVAGGGGDPLVGSIGALANEGLTGKIDVVSTDFLDDLKEQLESGGMFAESGGHFCDPLFAFLMTYNAVKGNYTKDEGSFGYEIEFPY